MSLKDVNFSHFIALAFHGNFAGILSNYGYIIRQDPTMKNITVYDRHRYIAAAICRILQDIPDSHIQAISPGKKDKTTIMQRTDVLVYSTQGCSDTFVRELKEVHQQYPALKSVLITDCIHKRLLQRIYNADVQAIISHKSSADELYAAIKAANNEQQYMSEDIGRIVVDDILNSPISELSNRELEITCMMANGANIQRVSHALNISPKTVSTYRSRIFNKLSITCNMELFQFINKEAAYLLAR